MIPSALNAVIGMVGVTSPLRSKPLEKLNVDQDRHDPRHHYNHDLFPHRHVPKLTPFADGISGGGVLSDMACGC
jgi:hypothetical protein